MLQKFLLIGVGGSGGKTLRYTWRELDRRLRASGWREGVPEAWRFLHIDVPQFTDVVEGDIPARLGPSAAYLGLAAAPRQYRDYDDDLVRRDELLPAVAGWRPDPALDYTSPFKGAGQRRVVGRVITLTQLDDVGRALDIQVAALANADVEEQLQRLGRHLDVNETSVNPDPATAVIISSLGGGAGSGAVLDIIELLKARATEQAEWLDNSLMTVLYAADVFYHLNPEKREGVEPNSLAALAELLAAFEHQGPVSEIEDRLLDLGGGTVQIRGRRIGMHNFMIGARNEAVTFSSSSDVFRAVGKAIATFIADDTVRHQFQTYLQTNWSGAPVMHEFRIAGLDKNNHPCSSFGYANVSLGRSLFGQYAEERLAKLALNRLLRGHREDVPADVLRRDETLVSERADAVRELFFEETGLYELSTQHNQVLDAFRDIPLKAKAIDDVLAGVKSKLNSRGGTKLSPKEWFDSFTSTFDDEARAYESEERAQRYAGASEWIPTVQARVLNAVARYVGAYGIPVTIALLERLEQQVEDAAAELEHDNHKFNGEETSLLGHAQQLFLTLREKLVTPRHPSFNNAAKDRREALQRRTEAELYSFTAGVLRDLNKGFLPLLRGALSRAEASLARAEQGEFKQIVEKWSARPVPPHLHAAPNEFLLDKESDFADQLDRLLEGTFEIEGARDAESTALQEVIAGGWPSIFEASGEAETQHLIKQTSQWRPSLTGARALNSGVGNAVFDITIGPDGLLESASAWVHDRRGPLSQYVHGTLRDWLAPTHGNAAARADRFADAINRALRSAAPLISVNSNAYRVVHSGDVPAPAYLVSEIPIDVKHGAYRQVKATLEAVGIEADVIQNLFNANSSGAEVEIMSFLGRSVHPVVFDSMMAPIQRDWQRRIDTSGRSQFWQFRRSRSLPSFVPLSPARQRALVRGWITANLLGHIPVLETAWSKSPLKVWSPRGTFSFPRYLLGQEVTRHSAVLPALMESLPLALLTFASGAPEELNAYLRLLDLGSAAEGPEDGYLVANAELAAWIRKGEVAHADPGFDQAPTPPVKFAGDASSTARERAHVIAERLKKNGDIYRLNVANQAITRESTLLVGRGWEVRDLVERATKELLIVAEQLGAHDPDNPDDPDDSPW